MYSQDTKFKIIGSRMIPSQTKNRLQATNRDQRAGGCKPILSSPFRCMKSFVIEPATWGTTTIKPKSRLLGVMKILKGNNRKTMDAVRMALTMEFNFRKITDNPRTATTRNNANWCNSNLYEDIIPKQKNAVPMKYT
ncbi:MAG: hypothetical protein ACTSYO_04600 [Candidatus Ranarchaeia archaeon]